jgi:hypothetical protein
MSEDDALAAEAVHAPLPFEARALGTALRAFHRLEAAEEDNIDVMNRARADIDRAGAAIDLPQAKALRAAQLSAFLAEVRRYEATGSESDELRELAGGFVPRMKRAGWARKTGAGQAVVVLNDAERRAAFKTMWNGLANVDERSPLGMTLDEQRVLYAFYIRHPHPTDNALANIDMQRAQARDRRTCTVLAEGEHMAAEAWRLEKIRKLGALDPSYPAGYAEAIAQYRRGSFRDAVRLFRDWIEAHPEGPYAIRARNFLRSSTAADERR